MLRVSAPKTHNDTCCEAALPLPHDVMANNMDASVSKFLWEEKRKSKSKSKQQQTHR